MDVGNDPFDQHWHRLYREDIIGVFLFEVSFEFLIKAMSENQEDKE
jgi:hypothetical protein